MNIICDANIWYDLGSGDISGGLIKNDINLVFTGVNLYELASTENMVNRFDIYRNACIAAVYYSKKQILIDPFSFLIGRRKEDDKLRFVFTEMEKFRNAGYFYWKDRIESMGQELLNRIEAFKQPMEEAVDSLNYCLEQVRATGTKIDLMQEDILRLMCSSALKLQKNSIDIDSDNCKVFISAITTFFQKFIDGRFSKFKVNDMLDILNLVYVGENDKYWTKDKRKVLPILQLDEMLAQQIYNPN